MQNLDPDPHQKNEKDDCRPNIERERHQNEWHRKAEIEKCEKEKEELKKNLAKGSD